MSLTTAPTTNPAVRTVDGAELPAAGSYGLDASHSQVGFAVRHLMVSKTRGRFSDFAGTVEIAENPFESSVAVTIQTASVDTRAALHIREVVRITGLGASSCTCGSAGMAFPIRRATLSAIASILRTRLRVSS